MEFLTVVGVGVLLICIYSERKAQGLYLGDYVFFAITFLVICITTICWQIYKTRAKEKELEIQTYKLYESSYSNLISEIRLKQHEFNNHINAIYSQHLICKNYEELVERQRQYCENILYDNRYEKLLKAGNSMLIGFLYGKFLEAEQRNIIVEYELICTELNVKIPIYKIVELVGNLLNNAMDALEKEENKRLYIAITEETKYVLIEVRNICKVIPVEQISEMFRKGYSSKGENRGLGLYNLKKMGQEYGFEIVCSNVLLDDKNWISFSVELEKSI